MNKLFNRFQRILLPLKNGTLFLSTSDGIIMTIIIIMIIIKWPWTNSFKSSSTIESDVYAGIRQIEPYVSVLSQKYHKKNLNEHYITLNTK